MGSTFRRNVVTTSGFFLLRFLVTIVVAITYILAAAGIQYIVVSILGETTFNYIVGGLLSLFLGIAVCNFVGSLIFMFVRGWHVAALAYANKIRKANAPAVTVGMKAFAKNIVGFGAVYGVRAITRNLLADFKTSLWELLKDVPFAQNLQKAAENPIIERMANDVLNYGFDATIYYLIRHPADSLEDVPATVIEGLKRYLCCLPSIMFTSLSSYVLFGVAPKVVKWIIIIVTILTQGILAGVLLVVLMWPIFYILENTFFTPLTMIMFISCFADKCEEEIDPNSETAKFVESIIDGAGIGTSSDDMDDAEGEEPNEEAEAEVEGTAQTVQAEEQSIFEDVAPDMSELEGQPTPGFTMPNTPPPPMRQAASRILHDSIPGAEGLSDLSSMPFADEDTSSPGMSAPLRTGPMPGPGRTLSDMAPDFESMLSGLTPPPPPPPVDEGPMGASEMMSFLSTFDARALNRVDDEEGVAEDPAGSSGLDVDDILSGGDFQ